MTYNKSARSIAPSILKKYSSKKKKTRQPTTPVKSNASDEVRAARRALNNMNEIYPYFLPKDKKRILRNLVRAIKKMR